MTNNTLFNCINTGVQTIAGLVASEAHFKGHYSTCISNRITMITCVRLFEQETRDIMEYTRHSQKQCVGVRTLKEASIIFKEQCTS